MFVLLFSPFFLCLSSRGSSHLMNIINYNIFWMANGIFNLVKYVYAHVPDPNDWTSVSSPSLLISRHPFKRLLTRSTLSQVSRARSPPPFCSSTRHGAYTVNGRTVCLLLMMLFTVISSYRGFTRQDYILRLLLLYWDLYSRRYISS